MELINFDGYNQNLKMYGGKSGQKIGINYNGEDYLLKFPRNLKEAQMKNIVLSYSNSPISEYIGSHIYEILGYDVHKTLLGTRAGKVVVACKDFREPGEELAEFEKILVTNETPSAKSSGSPGNNNVGIDLEMVLATIREHPVLKLVPEMADRFWDMFVIDALIGNPDRNNGNWGLLISKNGDVRIAPVYDNGNCLNNKWEEARMRRVMENPNDFKTQAYNGVRGIFTLNNKVINPFHIIKEMKYEECNKAVMRNVPLIYQNIDNIINMINGIPVLSDTQREFYSKIMQARYNDVLLPTCEKLREIEYSKDNGYSEQAIPDWGEEEEL